MIEEPVEVFLDDDLPRSLHDQLHAAIDAVVVTEEKAKQANIERKAARNQLAQILQGMGVTGFSIGA